MTFDLRDAKVRRSKVGASSGQRSSLGARVSASLHVRGSAMALLSHLSDIAEKELLFETILEGTDTGVRLGDGSYGFVIEVSNIMRYSLFYDDVCSKFIIIFYEK